MSCRRTNTLRRTQTVHTERLHPLTVALRAAMLGIVTATAFVSITPATAAETSTERHSYNIPAGPLNQSLTQFASNSGITLSFDPVLTEGKSVPALNGAYTMEEGLKILLSGTGLRVVPGANGGYRLVKTTITDEAGAVNLPTLEVTSNLELSPGRMNAPTQDGTQSEGYRASSIRQLGPLGETRLVNTPYSINVLSNELMANIQASKPEDALKLNPILQFVSPQSRFFTGSALRGFSTASTKRIDGLPSTHSYVNIDLEDKERIEVINGLSGFLYGSGNVGGTLNYVLKRPTYDRLSRVRVGVTEGQNALAHLDLGGSLDDDERFAYRFNGALQDGDTTLDHQSINRGFASVALDWNISDRAVIRLDASKSRYEMQGTEPYWSTTAGVEYPDAPDSDDFFGQPFTSTKTNQERLGLGLDWKISDNIIFRNKLARQYSELELVVTNNTFVSDGNYRVQTSAWEYPDVESIGGSSLFDIRFSTEGIGHQLVVGWYGDNDERTNFRSSVGGWTTLTSSPIALDSGPVYFADPGLTPSGDKYTAQRTRYDNWIVGDQMAFNEQWSAILGVNRASIKDKSFDVNGVTTSDYNDSKLTPTVALLYKPIPAVTVYGSYIESLEKGGTAPMTSGGVSLVNAGDTMPPMDSDQIEVGIKGEAGNMLLTAALFKINKALQYTDVSNPAAPEYVQDGLQVHKGIEFTATGRLTERLVLIGGFTVLNATMEENKSTPALEGNTPANIAEKLAKLYVEYTLPWVNGLTLIGGTQHTGSQQIDAANTQELPAYTLFDAGVRYETEAGNLPLVLRLGINNLTNESYWQNSNYIGRPRTIAASAQLTF